MVCSTHCGFASLNRPDLAQVGGISYVRVRATLSLSSFLNFSALSLNVTANSSLVFYRFFPPFPGPSPTKVLNGCYCRQEQRPGCL